MEDTELSVGPLSLRVHGYQFPETLEYWDSNWLLVTAEVNLSGQSWVKATGPFLMTSELELFRNELAVLYKNLDGEAGLWTIEPELKVKLESEETGKIAAEIKLTPNRLTQEHCFYFELDQSYLPEIQKQIDLILTRFPVKGKLDI